MEKTPLLKHDEKTKIANLAKAQVVFIVYHIAVNMHNPTIAQYLYKRFSEEVFENTTVFSPNTTSKCLLNTSDPGYLLQEKAQQLTSNFQVIMNAIESSIAFVSCVFLGAYSDYLGRRFLFVVCLMGETLCNAVNTAIIYWHMDMRFFYLAEVLEGTLGGYDGVMLASYAYAADNTPPRKSRTIGLAVVDFTTFLSLALSQAGNGFIIHYLGFMYPSLITTGLTFLAAVLVIILLPETVDKSGKTMPSPLVALKNMFGFYFSRDFKKTRVMFWLAVTSNYLVYFSMAGVYLLEFLFQMNQPFCWGPETIGYFNMTSAFAKMLLGIPVIKMLQVWLSDASIAIFTVMTFCGAFVLHALAYNDIMMFLYLVPFSLSMNYFIVIRAIFSRLTPPELQGSLFAGFTVMSILAGGVGVTACNELYAATVGIHRGFVFFVCAGICALVLILVIALWYLLRGYSRSEVREIVVKETETSQPTDIQAPAYDNLSTETSQPTDIQSPAYDNPCLKED